MLLLVCVVILLIFIFILITPDCIFSKIYWLNLWQEFLIYLKIKQKFSFPYDLKKYICKNSAIELQIKLFKSSKHFQQIIKKHRGKQCGEFYVKSCDEPFRMYVDDTNITMSMHWKHRILSEKRPLAVKELFSLGYERGLTNQDLEELYPKLDLTELKKIEIFFTTLNANVIRLYFVPSLVEIRFYEVIVENVDIPLILMEQCPLATKIFINWQENLTSLPKLAAVKRKIKIKDFCLEKISVPLRIQDIIDFVNNQMDLDYYLGLYGYHTLSSNLQRIPWEETMKILEQNILNFSETHIICAVTK